MKKSLLIILFLFSWTNEMLYAQNSIGISFFQTLTLTPRIQSNYNFLVGVKSDIFLTKRFSLSPAIEYGYEKYDIDYQGIIPSYGFPLIGFDAKTIKTDCVLKYHLTCGDRKVFFYALAGPSIQLDLYEKYNYGIVYTNNTLRFYNLSFMAGGGMGVHFGKFVLNIDPVFEAQLWNNPKSFNDEGKQQYFFSPHKYQLGLISYFSYSI